MGGPSSGQIFHDDGIALFVNGNLITAPGDEDPTVEIPTSYTITAAMVGQPFQLFYVAANDLPEVLISPNLVPLPGTVWLFGAGLGGIAMLMRRRRRGMVAA